MSGDGFTDIGWVAFRAVVVSKSLLIQEIPLIGSIRLRAMDGDFKVECYMHTDGDMAAEYTDYQTNFQPDANKVLVPRDSDGSALGRTKVTKTGWMFQLHTLEFATGKLNSIYNKDVDENEIGFATLKLFKPDGTEITTEADEALATLTLVSWEADHDIEVMGGDYNQAGPPPSDIRMWVRAVPDIPAQFGGSKDFIQGGLNLKLVPPGAAVRADGRAAKLLTYVDSMGLTKFHIYLRHTAGVNHTGQMIFEIFKP